MKKIILIMTLVVSLFTFAQTVTPEQVLAEYRAELLENGIDYEKYPIYNTVSWFLHDNLGEHYLTTVKNMNEGRNHNSIIEGYRALDVANIEKMSGANSRYYPTMNILILHVLRGYHPMHFSDHGDGMNIRELPIITTILTHRIKEETKIVLEIEEVFVSERLTDNEFYEYTYPEVIATEDSGWDYSGASNDTSKLDLFMGFLNTASDNMFSYVKQESIEGLRITTSP